MFDPSTKPRVFGLPPGADFAADLVTGLTARADDLSRTVIYVNTMRMQRRIRQLFDAGPPRLLPQVRLLTDLSFEATQAGIPIPVSPLRRRLELSHLVAPLLEHDDRFAPRAALYDVTDSLAKLMEEMHGEGVLPDAIMDLDVSDQSGHWKNALTFLNILRPFFDADEQPPDQQARLRLVAEALATKWQTEPPDHPVIVAGSTGSRGAAQVFMRAVARLPQGALVLPGFDFDMPAPVWNALSDPMTSQDHPQYRYHSLLTALDLSPPDVPTWHDTRVDVDRNKLISLSLRPAPVTHQWRSDGPKLGNLIPTTQALTLVEADTPRAEAEAIALRLRQAAADNQTAALITPDRILTRQVAAALDRWDIEPDDSAGTPLPLTASGRILRHMADAMGQTMTAEALLVMLKHPLTHSGGDRGYHLLRTRALELRLRRHGPPFVTAADIADWADTRVDTDPAGIAWAAWLGDILTRAAQAQSAELSDQLTQHITLTERLTAGPNQDGAGRLWDEKEGREARAACDTIARDADAGGLLSVADYTALFNSVLNDGTVRDRDTGHPGILIWGTLEARVGGADLVILGGMNDGVWPEAPSPDPWLNREMRKKAGLLLPERNIGLSAHDYQQAIGATEVWVTRAKRTADAETVPSRWVNRLLNLLDGLPDQNGPAALMAMRERGDYWLAQADIINKPDQDVDRAKRPSPRPPIAARPTEISVTQVKHLVRDPYAIYARKVLRLNKLDPLQPSAEAPLRGVIYHKILELFVQEGLDATTPSALTRLNAIAREQLELQCPWPTVRLQWLARMELIAPLFLEQEAIRQSRGTVTAIEAWGETLVGLTGVKLTCKADRIDSTPTHEALIYDYKTGAIPSKEQQKQFDKQLLLEAAMLTRGAFAKVGAMPVADAAFLGINKDMKTVPAPLEDTPPDQVWDEFGTLLHKWQQRSRGYTARMAMFTTKDISDFDHLARFGEWDISDTPVPEDLT